jgi:hypothetical protein
MSDNSKENWKNFFAVAAGTITGFLIAAFFLFFGIGFSAISDKWWGEIIIIFCFLILPCFWGGYVTSINSTKKDNRHAIVTGSFLLIIAGINGDFAFEGTFAGLSLSLCLVFAITLIGGMVGLYRKKKRTNGDTNSFPPGSSLQ